MDLPRQMKPVEVSLKGDDDDIAFYTGLIRRLIESRGDNTDTRKTHTEVILKIYPHAVND